MRAMTDDLGYTITEDSKKISQSKRRPVSTYRLQFNRSFAFSDDAKVVPHLHELGITDCYCSPYLKARPASRHGYDITDHNSLNPDLGSDRDYGSFVRQLNKHGMGQILDLVPNHTGIFGNSKWYDLLENGPSSIYSRYFDIDWRPAKAELQNRVLLPVLDGLYGTVLESGRLILEFDRNAFIIRYGQHGLPVGPRTWLAILEPCVRCRGCDAGQSGQ